VEDPLDPMATGGGTSSSGGPSSSAATGGGGGAGPGSGGAGATGGGSPGSWRADMWIGQVDHMAIRHLDTAADVCVLIGATAPSGATPYAVSIPEPWAIDMISVWDATEDCMDETFTPSEPSALAAAATGAIAFDVPPMQYYPCELDVDVVVNFDDPPSWLPGSLSMNTTMLPVTGACP
jgi:hypothetical protein